MIQSSCPHWRLCTLSSIFHQTYIIFIHVLYTVYKTLCVQSVHTVAYSIYSNLSQSAYPSLFSLLTLNTSVLSSPYISEFPPSIVRGIFLISHIAVRAFYFTKIFTFQSFIERSIEVCAYKFCPFTVWYKLVIIIVFRNIQIFTIYPSLSVYLYFCHSVPVYLSHLLFSILSIHHSSSSFQFFRNCHPSKFIHCCHLFKSICYC
jgi:hypothetical protein